MAALLVAHAAAHGVTQSAAALQAWVNSVISMVSEISSGRSRAVAAFQANWPSPGRSQSVSTGMAAPKAMMAETPARARNSGAQTGITWRSRMETGPTPLARAVRM